MTIGEEGTLAETTTGNGGEQDSEPENGTSRLKAAASRAFENGKDVAQCWSRQSRAMAANATDRIRHDPVRSVIISFVIGLSLGVLVARLSGRQCQ